ncbi:MAG: hypothetical protein KKB21_03280 [Nanoarchaeota archaeon]|nr:hypothetical protein [Nanoarchaeota archaeon]MBU4086573.1 hypothetical protein [Nanoarchaeota archaeon]
MFKINTETMRKGLEEALKNQINVIEELINEVIECPARGYVGDSLNALMTQKRAYEVLTNLSRGSGIDTASYDLTCSRLIEKVELNQGAVRVN